MDARQEILQAIELKLTSYKELENILSMSYNTVYNIINVNKRIDAETAEAIIKHLNKKGVINKNSDQCTMLNHVSLEFLTVINQTIAGYGAVVNRATIDKKLTKIECEKLIASIDNVIDTVTAELERLDNIKNSLRKL